MNANDAGAALNRVCRLLSAWRPARVAVRALIAVLVLLVPMRSSIAQTTIVQSNFDAGLEGWTVVTASQYCGPLTPSAPVANVSWQSTGGNSGGFMRHTESNVNTSFFRAPAAFHGNLSAALGGAIVISRRFSANANFVLFNDFDDVHIQSGSTVLLANINLPGRDIWDQFTIPLLPGYWRLQSCNGPAASEAQIQQVLNNVTDIYVRAEYVSGNETEDIDGVSIVGPPPTAQCQSQWELVDNDAPTARWRHAVAVDTDRSVLVLFGGDTGETDTWEYSLTTGAWVQRITPTSPTRKGGHAMVYDRARHKVVLTGGGYNGTASSEVWEYDGVIGDWSLSTALPQARSGHAMAYDTARDTIVLYGGLGSGATNAVDVLERSSSSSAWAIRTSATNPGPQTGYAMAYDSVRALTVLVGEGTNNVSVSEWDGVAGTWTLRSFITTLPTTRLNPGLTYDSSRSRIVLLGGEGKSDTWDYNGTVWTQRANINPGGRDEHAVAFDAVNSRVLLSGGLLGSAGVMRDLLAFNGATNSWSTLWSVSSPSPRYATPIAFDEIGARTVLYGGGLVTRPGIVQQVGGGTFLFDGVHWSNPTVTGAPPTAWAAPMVYDSDRRVMIVYGGRTGSTTATASRQVWELNLATLAWQDRTLQPSSPPGQRWLHAAAYDRLHHRMVVHGGLNESGVRLGDTWLYDGAANTWTMVPPATSPGVRSDAAMAYDERRGVVVLFGGLIGAAGTYDATTWQWDGASWSNVSPPTGNPPMRLQPSLVYDPDRGTVVLSGGMNTFSSNGEAFTDLWEFDGKSWRQLYQAGPPEPIARWESAVSYDTARRRLVHFSGASIRNGAYTSGQTWELPLPCIADFDCSGFVNGVDFDSFVDEFTLGNAAADIDHSGFVNGLDFDTFVEHFEAGC